MPEDNKKPDVDLEHHLGPSENEPVATTPAPETYPIGQQPLEQKPENLPKGKKRKFFIIGIVAASILLFAGAAGATYYAYYLPNTPQNVLRQALANELSAEAFEQSGKINGELNIQGEGSNNANVTFSVTKDQSNGLALNVKSFGVSADFVTQDGKTVYVKLGGLKGLDKILQQYSANLPLNSETLQNLGPVINALNDQWYQIDSSLLGNSDLQNNLGGNFGLSQEDLDKIADIYMDNEFIVVDEKGDTTQISGRQATEYKLHIDGQKLKEFAVDLKNANIEKIKITDDDIQQLNEFVDKNNLADHQFSLWIDDQKRIIQFSYSHQFDSTKVNIKLTVSERGSNIKIEAPANSKSIFELLGEISPLLQNLEEDIPSEDVIQQLRVTEST